MDAIALTEQNYATEVESAPTPVLLYFWGEHCGYCRAMGPIIEQVRQERADSVKVAKVNAQEEMQLAARFGVRGLPTLLFLKDGQVKDTHTGALSKKGVLQKLDALSAA